MGIHLELCKEQIENITGFLGYGNPMDSVWFVGVEEGLGKATSKDAIENLGESGSFERIMDLRDAHHKRLRERGQLIDFDAKPPYTPVWQWIAKVMCASSGNDWREYVRCRLGRSDGETFLTESSPIPAGNAADNTWMEAFQALDDDLTEKLERRKTRLLELLDEKHPRMVICYGNREQRARELERYFGLEWTAARAGILTGSRRACPFLLLPFFCCGQMSQSVIEELRKLGLLPGQARATKSRNLKL